MLLPKLRRDIWTSHLCGRPDRARGSLKNFRGGRSEQQRKAPAVGRQHDEIYAVLTRKTRNAIARIAFFHNRLRNNRRTCTQKALEFFADNTLDARHVQHFPGQTFHAVPAHSNLDGVKQRQFCTAAVCKVLDDRTDGPALL